MREREQLARNGILLIDISVDKFHGRLLHEPEIITRGFVSPEDAESLIPEVRKRVMDSRQRRRHGQRKRYRQRGQVLSV